MKMAAENRFVVNGWLLLFLFSNLVHGQTVQWTRTRGGFATGFAVGNTISYLLSYGRCCPNLSRSGMSVLSDGICLDGTKGTPCCATGSCNTACCNCAGVCRQAPTGIARVTLFEHKQFKGDYESIELHLGQCAQVDSWMANKISSVNTHGTCVRVYFTTTCEGRYMTVAPGRGCHSDLSMQRCMFGFWENSVKSVSDCIDM